MGRSRKNKWSRRTRTKPGAAPGQLIARPEAARGRVSILAYGPEGLVERSAASLQEAREQIARWPTTWINVDGVADVETIAQLGEMLGLHRLALEDVVNLGQRAKCEAYDEDLFIVVRMPPQGDDPHGSEQVSMFVGPTYIVTFQERAGDPFDPVRERIRNGKGRIRTAGPDYLAYTLLDASIDGYFPLLEVLGQRLESLERQVVDDPKDETLGDLLRLRSELLSLRRDLLPLRDMVQSLIRGESPLIKPATTVFLRDCADHVEQLVDLLEVYREVSSDLMHCYMSNVSNRLNEVMKVLTIVTAVFIPLSFVASIYGMNFDPDTSPWNMPELRFRYGYPLVLLVMLLIGIAMLVMFRRKGWLGRRRLPREVSR